MSERPGIRVEAVTATGAHRAVQKPLDAGAPFRMLVIADISGRANRGLVGADAFAQEPRAIDRDDLETVLAAAKPTLRLAPGVDGRREDVVFGELDDFHPDRLLPRVPVFESLRRLRRRLSDPTTANAALAEMMRAAAAPEVPPPAAPEAGGASFDVLESALRAAEAAPRPAGDDLVTRLVREFVAPHAVPKQDPRVADRIADVEAALAAQMRAVLAAPGCRGLEGAWRCLDLLVRRVETDARLSIHVLDASPDDLRSAFADGGDPLRSTFARLLIDRVGEFAGGVPYALVVADHEFAPSLADVATLAGVAEVCAAAGSVFVAAASPAFVGAADLAAEPDPEDWTQPLPADVAAAWQALRERPCATSVGLVMPRFLLRLPYGRRTSPVTVFPFEEEGDPPTHADLVWGNGAFLVAILLASTWRRDGWSARTLADDRIDDLPSHCRRVDGGVEAMPVTGCRLTGRGAQHMSGSGFMPLYGVRDSDAAQLGALRSIAVGAVAPLGRWGTR